MAYTKTSRKLDQEIVSSHGKSWPFLCTMFIFRSFQKLLKSFQPDQTFCLIVIFTRINSAVCMRECELEKKGQNCRKTAAERKYPSTSSPLPPYPALIFFAQHEKAAGVYAQCLGIDSSAIERCLAVQRSVKCPRATAVEDLSMEFQ